MRQRIPTAKKLLAGPAEKLCGEKSKERGTGSGAETTLLRGGAGAGLSENPLVSGVRSWDSLQAPRRGGGWGSPRVGSEGGVERRKLEAVQSIRRSCQ